VIDTAPTAVAVEPSNSVATSLPPPASTLAPASTVDGGGLLQHALDELAAGYHFTTTVTVDGVVRLVADGDRVADGTRLDLTGDGGTDLVRDHAGGFVGPAGRRRVGVDRGTPAAVDPIGALRSPSAITVDAVEGAETG
jgi:hypothetical protein